MAFGEITGGDALRDIGASNLGGLSQYFNSYPLPEPKNMTGALGGTDKGYVDKDVNNFVKGLFSKDAPSALNDPTFLGFTFYFDWYESPLFGGALNENSTASSSLTQSQPTDLQAGTAINYLTTIGEESRVKYLRAFTQQLKTINDKLPWYWQKIEGLDTMWKTYTNLSEPFRGGDEQKIVIETLESIDLKIQGMLSLYMSAAFDFKYRRAIIPVNLRRFNLVIVIQEIRKFQSTIQQLQEQSTFVDSSEAVGDYNEKPVITSQGQDDNLAENFKDNISTVVCTLTDCEFVLDEVDFFGNISNSEATMTKNKLSIKYHDISIDANVPWLNYAIKQSLNPTDMDMPEKNNFGKRLGQDMKSKLKSKLEDEAKRLEAGAINFAATKAKSLIQNTILGALDLGNVYSQGNTILSAITNASLDGVVNGIKQRKQAKDLFPPSGDLGTIFDNGTN